MSETAIIIGGGHATAELATSLRDQGWTGPIAVYTQENRFPYHRPPLSKAFMAGTTAAENLSIKQPAAYEKAAADFHFGVTVTAIDAAAHTITLQDGSVVGYARLALATGSRARTLHVPGAEAAAHAANYLTLRTLEQAEAIRARLIPGARVVVIGAGYIGLELAASAVGLGAHVTVIEAQDRVLARVTGAEVSHFYEAAHRAAGVDLHLSTGVASLQVVDQRVTGVTLSNGAVVQADLVVVGVGVEPNTALAAAAGLQIDNGIAVDQFCRSSAADIVAAGDCTSHPSDLYGRRIRLESVPNALEQARTAAATMNGKERAYQQAPWFWSDQFDLRMKSVGLLQGYDQVVLRGDPATRSFCAFYLQGTRVLAVDTINRAPEFLLAKRIVAEQLQIPAAVLADDSTPLKEALPPAA